MGVTRAGGSLGFLLKFLTARPIWDSFFCMLDYIDFRKALMEVVRRA
jgi:hypothetical protein